MSKEVKDYLDFLKYCLAPDSQPIPDCVKDIDWMKLLEFAHKHAIVGVYWQSIQHLGNLSCKLDEDTVMEWMTKVIPIQRRNGKVDAAASKITKMFGEAGFDTCILKGQGNALLYPDPSLRNSGDCDVYVRCHDNHSDIEQNIRTIIAYCRKHSPKGKATYHHIDYSKVDGVETEVHYRPSWLSYPYYNRRLQRYYWEHADEVFANEVTLANGKKIHVPTREYNMIFQLCHIYKHLFQEGIGLRQIIDYFYLLASPGPSDGRGAEMPVRNTLRYLGLENIGGAVMWILINVLGMEAKYAIAEPDERRGRFVLNEILEGGNFGKFDQRAMSGTYASPLKANIQRLVRDARLLRYFPSEALWEPWFRTWHFFWRWRHR